MKSTPGLWLLTCILLLSACQASQAGIVIEAADEQPRVVVSAAPAALPTVRRPTPTGAMPEPQPSPTLVTATKQPEAKRQTQICSPLGGFSLEELPEIVSSPYAPPPPGRDERHHGVDFAFYQRGERASIEGVIVQTALGGRVAAAIHDRFPYGNMVIIETLTTELSEQLRQAAQLGEGESLYLLYAHMAEGPEVEIGAALPACFPLGSVGKSGNADIAHLHWETRLGPAGAQFSGMAYYRVQTTQEERDNYALWRMSGVFRHFNPLDLLTKNGR